MGGKVWKLGGKVFKVGYDERKTLIRQSNRFLNTTGKF